MDIQIIQNKIYEIRGQRVMLDFDLANMYQIPTKALIIDKYTFTAIGLFRTPDNEATPS